MFTKVTLKEIKNIATNSKNDLVKEAKSYNRSVKIYLHWTAGRYDSMFNDYHINIKGNGDLYVSTKNFAETLAHTYKRNSGSIGIALCCAYNANTKKLGSYKPTDIQIEALAQVVCVLADVYDMEIIKNNILTHGEAADNEDGLYPHSKYGPKSTCERWDLEYLETKESPSFNPYARNGSRGGDVIRGKAIWYMVEGLAKSL